MIYIVHGDNTSKSRALIINHQKKLGSLNKINLDVTEISPERMFESCASNTLFGDSPFVVLDITDGGRMNFSEYIGVMKKLPERSNLVVYSAKALSKTNAFIAGASTLGAKIIESTDFHDANIFKFTDSLFSRNRVQTYKELGKLLQEDYDPFYTFSMVLYGLRNVAKLMWDAPSISKMKPFQIEKIKGQTLRLTKNKIKDLYEYLYGLEKKTKTGVIQPETMVTLSVEKVLNA